MKNRSLLVRGLVILGLVVLAAFSAHPLDERIKLGLDLQGGMHLVLQVQTADAVDSETDKDMTRLLDVAEERDLANLEARKTGPQSFEVTGVDRATQDVLVDIVKDFRNSVGAESWDSRRSANTVRFDMTGASVKDIERLSVRQALETIRNRVDAFGVSEPVIQPLGDSDRLVVQLPGVDDQDRVRDLIKRTAFLEFRLTDFPRSGGGGAPTREAVLANYGGTLPSNVEILEGSERDERGRAREYFAVEATSVVTGRDLKNARPSLGQFNEPVVNFTFNAEGADRFGEATGNNVGRGLAIILDNKVVTAPVINSRISDSGIIEGNFTQQEVEDLSTVLRTGALPAGITYLEERTVGPSLGRDSIEQGLRAGLVGFGLVILIMFVVYRFTGINAIVALVLDVVLVFGALAYFGATLTLPGIAGIILTVGMAVDANVLVFERIREELRVGRTVRSAVDAGFSKALSSVLDANITTLIASLFLFQFGTGPIRGFAVTLSIGILASVFTAVIVSRWIFDLIFSRRGRVERLSI
ncbi:MAG: protein translocase subunit SecD [Acidobacteriota bacterium]